MPLRKKVLIVDEKLKKYPIYFAYNDLPGKYNLILTNVATGLESQKQLTLK